MTRPNVFTARMETMCKQCKDYCDGECVLERNYATKLYSDLVNNPKTKTWTMIAKDTFDPQIHPEDHVVDASNHLMFMMVDVQWTCPKCGSIKISKLPLNPFVGDWDNFLTDLKSYVETKEDR